MTTLTVLGVLTGAALAGCGGVSPAPAPTPGASTPGASTPAAPEKPPTMAPGPAGRTPVFERRPTGGARPTGRWRRSWH